MSENYNIEELIIRFLQQDINEEELRYLVSWLEEDVEHKSYFFGLKSISDSSRYSFFAKEEVNEANWQKMLARIKNNEERIYFHHKSRIRDIWKMSIKYVAVAILAIGLGWGIHGFWDRNSSSLAGEKIVYNEIRVPKGGRTNTLILSDSTKVILNAATTFKYPVSFNGEKRQVYLSGEAYFEVVKNKEKPFIVKLNNQNITVLGTTFNVRSYENDSYSAVTLLSGQVMLDAFNEFNELTGHILLNPNQYALTNNKSGLISVSDVDASLENAWLEGVYKFKNESLLSITKCLENYYDVHIHLNDSRLERIRYTGTFSLEQDIMEVLRIVDYEKQMIIKRVNKDIFITRK